jgi:drug/metabolite transporter (DMT)-like permease
MKTVHWQAQCLRGLIGIVGVFAYFGAVVLLPLASAITLIYTSPLLLAAVMLVQARQRPSLAVLGTLGAGFLGVLLLVQPSFTSTQWLGVTAALLSALMAVAAALHIRTLARLNEPAWRTVAWFSLFVMLAATPGYVSSHPGELSFEASISVLAMGLAGALGQVFMTFAYQRGHALLVSLLGYAQIVFTTLIGVLWWHEHPGFAAWLGIALIIGSGGVATHFMGRVNIGRPPRSS